jgi:MFS transporter, FHS family, L-fucose permease
MTGTRKNTPAIVLTLSMFALWGFGHRLYDTLVPPFAKVFELSSLAQVLTQSVYGIVYLLFAIPAAMYARRFGYKATMVAGLGGFAIGAFLFYPAAEQHAFAFFIFAAVVMSTGWAMLEIGANPLIARLGPADTIVRRLNFAHALYPVGVLTGLYMGRWVILSDLSLPVDKLAHAVVQPCIAIGVVVLLLAFLFDKTPFPPVASEHVKGSAVAEIRTLMARPRFVAGVGAQVCYAAARASTWGLAVRYVTDAMPGISTTSAADVLLWCLVIYGAGRFVATALMYRFEPAGLLALFAGGGVVLAAAAAVSGGPLGVACVLGTCFCMSTMMPTILGLSIRDLGPLMNTGTALVYTGGSGGALGLLAVMLIWTVSSAQYAMLVPALGYAAVMAFGLYMRRGTTAAHHAAVPAAG